jgi:hypothetical protein
LVIGLGADYILLDFVVNVGIGYLLNFVIDVGIGDLLIFLIVIFVFIVLTVVLVLAGVRLLAARRSRLEDWRSSFRDKRVKP